MGVPSEVLVGDAKAEFVRLSSDAAEVVAVGTDGPDEHVGLAGYHLPYLDDDGNEENSPASLTQRSPRRFLGRFHGGDILLG